MELGRSFHQKNDHRPGLHQDFTRPLHRARTRAGAFESFGKAGVGGGWRGYFFFFQASASGQYDKDIMDNEDVSFYSTVFGHQD